MRSRSDRILLNNALVPLVTSSDISAIHMSDHAPVSIQIDWGDNWVVKGCRIIPQRILRDPVMKAYLQMVMENYFTDNEMDEVGEGIVLDAFKIVTRGHCISAMSHIKRLQREHRESFERALKLAEVEYAKTPCRQRLQEPTRLRGELKIMGIDRAELALLRIKCKYYSQGSKVGTLLA